MQRHPLSPEARALLAFAGTVVFAVLAAVSSVMPDIAIESVDSTAQGLAGLDQILAPGVWSP